MKSANNNLFRLAQVTKATATSAFRHVIAKNLVFAVAMSKEGEEETKGGEAEQVPAVETRHLKLSINGTLVLEDVTFKLPPGSRCMVLGPNGAGTTLSVVSLYLWAYNSICIATAFALYCLNVCVCGQEKQLCYKL